MLSFLVSLAVAVAAPASATELRAPGPDGPLAGTWQHAVGKPRATLLIVPGSGPTDRDGNNALGVAGGPYRRLAEALAIQGVASVRIDKRGMFGSRTAVADPNKVRIDDYAADVRTWVAAARAATGAQCVWLLGHSEGGLVSLAASRSPDVCGLILVATVGRPMGDVIRAQLRANPANAPLLNSALTAIDRLEAGEHVDVAPLHPALQQLFAPQIQDYLIDAFKLDPAKMVAGYEAPVLIVQGDRDLQVDVADARRLAAANARAKLVVLPGVNHLLRHVESADRAANAATYADESAPLAAGVAEAIGTFVIGDGND